MTRPSQIFSGAPRAPRPSTLTRRSQLTVQALEGRDVPSATMVDLTTRGSDGEINGAMFRQDDTQPTGSGAIHSFVRIEGAAAKTPLQQGYNTDARPLQFNENKSPTFTRSLRLSEIPKVTIDGETYRVVLLDINQSASRPLLSLDQLRLYVADVPNLKGYDAATGKLGGHAPVYDMDSGGDSWVKLNSRLNSGSGSGDMRMLVPEAVFAGAGANPYVYLYSEFGEHLPGASGLQEWAPGQGPGGGPLAPLPPPPGPTLSKASLSGTVFLDYNQNSRYDAGEDGVAGVLMTLTQFDSNGNAIATFYATTDSQGYYSFTDLPSGTFRLSKQPASGQFVDASSTPGSVGATTHGQALDANTIDAIVLVAGDAGTNFNFGELRML